MKNRALRLFGIMVFILLLVLTSSTALLWLYGKDWLESLTRNALATSGVTVTRLDWTLATNGIILENLNIDIEDSQVQLQGLQITFDKPLSQLSFEVARSYLFGKLSLPMPKSIALEQSDVFLGSRSLSAASSQQASDQAAIALDMDTLPLIALGPIMIATVEGKLLKLDYLSLSSTRELIGRIATANDEKVVGLNAEFGQSRWQAKLDLSLNGVQQLVQQLANAKLPIDDTNPLAQFLHKQRDINTKLRPNVAGTLSLQSSLELDSAAMASELSFRGVSLELAALKSLKLTLSDTSLNARFAEGKTEVDISPFRLAARLTAEQRNALAMITGSDINSSHLQKDAQTPLQTLAQAPAPMTDAGQSSISRDVVTNMSQALFEDEPLNLEIAAFEGITLKINDSINLSANHMMASAEAKNWRWQLSSNPTLNYSANEGVNWQSPIESTLNHQGELDLDQLLPRLKSVPNQDVSVASAKVKSLKLLNPSVTIAAELSVSRNALSSRVDATVSRSNLSINSVKVASATKPAASDEFSLGKSEINLDGIISFSYTKPRSPEPALSDKQLSITDTKLQLNLADARFIHKKANAEQQVSAGLTRAQLYQTEPLTLIWPNETQLKSPSETQLTSPSETQLTSHRETKLESPSKTQLKSPNEPLIDKTQSAPDLSAMQQATKQAAGQATAQMFWPVAQLMSQQANFQSHADISKIRVSLQSPRRENSQRLKTSTYQLDTLALTQQLHVKDGQLNSEEQWRIGAEQPLTLQSTHHLMLSPSLSVTELNADWHGRNSLGDWREAAANIANYAPDVRLAGDTELSAKAALNFVNKTKDIRLKAQLNELSGTLGTYPFHGAGLSANCGLQHDQRLSDDVRFGCKEVSWKLAHFAPGIMLDNIEGKGSISVGTAPDGTLSEFDVSLTSQGELLNGKFFLPSFKLNEHKPSHAYLVLTGLSLEELLELQPVEGIKANGVFDGVLPVDMKRRKISVTGGRLAARAPGGLIEVTNNPDIDDLVLSQPHLALVFDALKHLNYSSLAGDFNMLDNGDATVDIEVKGQSQGIERPIHLNYSHQENLWQLLRSLSVADKLQNQIEQNIN